MTPYDIYRHWEQGLYYIAPELVDEKLLRTKRAIWAVEEIFDAGPNTEAGAEAVEVLRMMREFEKELRLSR